MWPAQYIRSKAPPSLTGANLSCETETIFHRNGHLCHSHIDPFPTHHSKYYMKHYVVRRCPFRVPGPAMQFRKTYACAPQEPMQSTEMLCQTPKSEVSSIQGFLHAARLLNFRLIQLCRFGEVGGVISAVATDGLSLMGWRGSFAAGGTNPLAGTIGG